MKKILFILIFALLLINFVSADIISFTYVGDESFGNPSQVIEGFGFGDIPEAAQGGGGSTAFNYDISICNFTYPYLLKFGKNISISFLYNELSEKYNINLNQNTLKYYYVDRFEIGCEKVIIKPLSIADEEEFEYSWLIIIILVFMVFIICFLNRKRLILFYKKKRKKKKN